MNYAAVLTDAITDAPVASGLSRPELEQRIAAISDRLKGSLGDGERIMLCADRASFRKALVAA